MLAHVAQYAQSIGNRICRFAVQLNYGMLHSVSFRVNLYCNLFSVKVKIKSIERKVLVKLKFPTQRRRHMQRTYRLELIFQIFKIIIKTLAPMRTQQFNFPFLCPPIIVSIFFLFFCSSLKIGVEMNWFANTKLN